MTAIIGRDIPPEVRLLVLDRDGWACACCGASVIGRDYSLAPRLPLPGGGTLTPENLLTLLGDCRDRIDLYRDPDDGIGVKGYRLPSGTDPAMERALIVSGDADAFLAWLTADGRYAFEPPQGVAA